MKIVSNKDRKVVKHQQGGMISGAEQAPAPVQGGQDQMMAQLEQMAIEIINSVGPEGAAMLAEMIMTMLQSQAPVGAPQGAPVFAKGGKIIRRK